MEFVYLLVGLLVGALVGWLLGVGRTKGDPARIATAEERAKGEADRREEAEGRCAAAEAARLEVERRLASAEEQERQATKLLMEQREFVEKAQQQMVTTFRAAAATALGGNNEQFLALAKQRLDTSLTQAASDLDERKVAIGALVQPLTDSLNKLETQAGALELARVDAYGRIGAQVEALVGAAAGIQRETVTLSTALKGGQERGRWGEIALRNVVELSGMTEHCDFDQQQTTSDGKRPDLIVHLPGGRSIAVDSKATMSFYMAAVQAKTDTERTESLIRHGKAVRDRVKDLAGREYAAGIGGTVDLVVLFLPGEPFLSAAFQVDPELHEDALRLKILVAAPTTLVALLRTVAIYHQQAALARDAGEIAEAARTLYERGAKFAEHLSDVGRGLGKALDAYNSAVGSFEGRFLVAGRDLERLKVAAQARQQLEAPKRVEGTPRQPTALPVPAQDPIAP